MTAPCARSASQSGYLRGQRLRRFRRVRGAAATDPAVIFAALAPSLARLHRGGDGADTMSSWPGMLLRAVNRRPKELCCSYAAMPASIQWTTVSER
jgi:hypothetical protein